MNKEEHIRVITDKEELYDKCDNMEQLYDKYYLPLLCKHYDNIYKLQRENKQLSKYKKVIKEIENLEKYWLKGGTYVIPVEVMNNIYGMIEEIESVENNE